MGFLERARNMAEQARAKIDEAQEQFNRRGGRGTGPDETPDPGVPHASGAAPLGGENPEPTPAPRPAEGAPREPLAG